MKARYACLKLDSFWQHHTRQWRNNIVPSDPRISGTSSPRVMLAWRICANPQNYSACFRNDSASQRTLEEASTENSGAPPPALDAQHLQSKERELRTRHLISQTVALSFFIYCLHCIYPRLSPQTVIFGLCTCEQRHRQARRRGIASRRRFRAVWAVPGILHGFVNRGTRMPEFQHHVGRLGFQQTVCTDSEDE